eukprot:TRINITY_DN625_c0_g1_i1.p2 TRINITY_DN625_c0_g1~~TRINITY_DN625_c0_g1_i1.p2  ORF type:complete len:208 (+),score=-37.88 TRINITY_DN625_c0_g1_i1:576-1199(+)
MLIFHIYDLLLSLYRYFCNYFNLSYYYLYLYINMLAILKLYSNHQTLQSHYYLIIDIFVHIPLQLTSIKIITRIIIQICSPILPFLKRVQRVYQYFYFNYFFSYKLYLNRHYYCNYHFSIYNMVIIQSLLKVLLFSQLYHYQNYFRLYNLDIIKAIIKLLLSLYIYHYKLQIRRQQQQQQYKFASRILPLSKSLNFLYQKFQAHRYQ